VRENQRSAVDFLLAHVADASVVDPDGETVMEVARGNNFNELVDFLESRGGLGRLQNVDAVE
jgi:hypothetical protein